MREAAVPGYKLSKARRSTKVLISLGMLGLLLGLSSAAALSVLRIGLSPTAVQNYYLGDPATNDALGGLLTPTARPISELAEVTHLHLVGGSMLLFFLCHLLALCEISENVRTTIYCTAFASYLLTFGTPWLVVFVNPAASYIFGPAIITFIASLIICTSIPLYEMWKR